MLPSAAECESIEVISQLLLYFVQLDAFVLSGFTLISESPVDVDDEVG